MRQYKYEARQRYNSDPTFHAVVRTLGKWMLEFKLSPNELHDAVNLAGDLISLQQQYQYKGEKYEY